MRRRYRVLLAALVLAFATGAVAQTSTTGQTALGKVTITSNGPMEGTFRGTWQWTKGVTVTSQGLTLTCDTLKVWPAKSGRDFDRVEAEGNVKIKGSYTASDKTKWSVNGSAQHAEFDNRARVGKLAGSVDLHAVNQADKSAVSAKADTFTYNQKTQTFRLDRNGQPVAMEFEPGPAPAGGKGSAGR